MINLNRLTTAVTVGHTHLYQGDHKLDAVEVISTVAQLRASLEELDDRTSGSVVFDDEGDCDAVRDFIAETRSLLEQFEE